MAVTKWSVSVEETLVAPVEARVGDRGLSGFVARAVEHELERDLFYEYLVELDAEFGPVPEGLVEDIDERWPSWSWTATRSQRSPAPPRTDLGTRACVTTGARIARVAGASSCSSRLP